MYKKLLILFLLFTVTFLSGCRIFDSKSDNVIITPVGTLVKTKVLKPVISSNPSIRGNLRNNIRAAITTEVVVGASVKIILSDGTTYTLTDNGNGEYSAIISNLENAKGFIIEAKKGEFIAQNIIHDIKSTQLSNITTDHITTALTQVTLAFAQQQGLQVSSVNDLIKNITSLQININTIKKEIEDGVKVEYAKISELFTVALAEAKTNQESQLTIIDKLKNNQVTLQKTTLNWTEVITKPIVVDSILLPPILVPSDDENQIKQAVEKFIDAFAKAMKGEALSSDELQNISNIISENFVLNGQTKTHFIQLLSNPSSDYFDEYITNKNINIICKKIATYTYIVDVIGQVTLKDKNTDESFTETINSSVDGYSISQTSNKFSAQTFSPNDLFPLIVQKHSDNTWKIMGNNIKVQDIYVELIYSRDFTNPNNPNEFAERSMIWFSVDETASFPINEIKVTGIKLPQYEIQLEKYSNLGDSNQWTYWYKDQTGSPRFPHPYPAPNGWPLSGTGSVLHKNGDRYTIEVTYRDSTNLKQYFTYVLSNLPANIAPLVATITYNSQQGKINIEWEKETATNFESYELVIIDQSQNISGDPTLLRKSIRDRNKTSDQVSVNLSNSVSLSGKRIGVMVKSRLKNGVTRQYSKVLQVPAD